MQEHQIVKFSESNWICGAVEINRSKANDIRVHMEVIEDTPKGGGR